MNESFLHFVWKYRMLKGTLRTTEGEIISIEHPGWHNHDAGPDFSTAKIRIEDTLWVGNVEIHINSSDWIKHQHQHDPAYQNIILHVVFNHDKNIGIKSPTCEIRSNIELNLYHQYLDLINNKNWIPCETHAHEVDYFIWEKWKERMLIERMEKKHQELSALLQRYRNSWEEVFYIMMARNFGFKVNSGPFELLAKSTPLKYLAKIKNNILQVEAMLFGQAGLLEGSFTDAYPKALQQEYKHLRNKFGLQPIDKSLWRFLRLRPANFPTIRIAQLAQLIHKSSSLFSYVKEAQKLDDIKNLLIIKATEYWQNHYVFDKETIIKPKFLGETAINLILINTIIPTLFAYGQEYNNQSFKEKALRFMTETPAEKNHIITKWKAIGIHTDNAFHTQALLYLKKNYCTPKKCLQCPIAKRLLARN